MKLAFESGSGVNEKTTDGRTPLQRAIFKESEEIVRYLVAHGADLNAKDSRGYTPAKYAEFRGKKLAALIRELEQSKLEQSKKEQSKKEQP